MTIKKNSGNALIQYTIILVLLACVVVPGFWNMGRIIIDNLNGLNTTYKNNNGQIHNNAEYKPMQNGNTDQEVKSFTIKPGELGGSINNPQVKCIGKVCSVDFGDYVFNNLPINYKEFVESSGFSGGTRLMASLLDQLVEQAGELPTPINDNLIIQLAQQGHVLADYESDIELAAKYLQQDYSLDPQSAFIKPANSLLNGGYRTQFEKNLKLINQNYALSESQQEKDLLMLINFLSNEITTLADLMGNIASDAKGNKVTPEMLDSMLQPNASLITDFDSAIICISGDGIDNNNMCSQIK